MHYHHLTVNSHRPRTSTNPLFASNYLDRELRKTSPSTARDRLLCPECREHARTAHRYMGWHNYVKPYRSEREPRTAPCEMRESLRP
jgi:hypothetical protein